jgi:hypothetical protein
VALLQRMTLQAQAQLGIGYALLGDLQVNVQQVIGRNTKQHAIMSLSVQGTGTWAYQFSEADLQHLSHLIAGKNRQQATALLLDQPGVGEVAMSADALPSDPQHIRVLVLYRPV